MFLHRPRWGHKRDAGMRRGVFFEGIENRLHVLFPKAPAIHFVEGVDGLVHLGTVDKLLMLSANAAQHEAEGNRFRAIFLVDHLRVAEVWLPVVHKLGVYHFVSGLFVGCEADFCCREGRVEMLHLADQRDRGIGLTAFGLEGLECGRDWQGAHPSGDSGASPRRRNQIVREMHNGTGGVLE